MVAARDLKSLDLFVPVRVRPVVPIIGLKVFMDAHHTVTVEEWGSLPPKTAKTYLRFVRRKRLW